MLTNDSYYIRGAKSGSLCEQFSTADKREDVHGFLDWAKQTNTAKGHSGFNLDGNYFVQWDSYEIENIIFYQTIIPVQ